MTGSKPAGGAGGSSSLLLLGLITFSGTLGMHIFVPALPQLAQDLNTNAAAAQLSISFYILGLAFGQLVIGPLSDRYGRRPTLIAGLVLYSVAGFACALAPDINALIIARMLQALGGCAGLVLGRAIVRDGVAPQEATRRLALMNLITIIGPGAAPILGGEIAAAGGWRTIMFVLCAFGFANMILAWGLLRESAAPAKGISIREIMQNYRLLVRTPAFLGYTIGGACASTSVYAFLSAAPFIFVNQLHASSREVGLYLAMILLGAWLGSLAASRMSRRAGRLMVKGNCLSLAAASVFLIAAIYRPFVAADYHRLGLRCSSSEPPWWRLRRWPRPSASTPWWSDPLPASTASSRWRSAHSARPWPA